MRLYWLFFLMVPLLIHAESDEEALFLRRIADFWQEGEYQIAKSQMEEFIVEYPESSFSDALCAALGDLYLREKNFSNALSYYTRVQTSEFYTKVFLNRMQCLYEMQWYATLADECESYLESGPNLHVTYFLAIALYHQCLNVSKDPDTLVQLAERARPYFETLSQSELSHEVAQGFAHLCFILKDFTKASDIYLDLAKQDPESQEEMLFQVALIQSQYDKELAIQTFDQIIHLGQKRGKEAAYNRLVLSFDTGHYEELTKENLCNEIPPEKVEMAKLFIGKSLLNLKKFPEAVVQLKAYIQDAPLSERDRSALLCLVDASYQSNDLVALDQAIAKLAANYPQDPELPKAYFSRAQVLKKNQNLKEARHQLEQLLVQFPQFQQKAQVIFELAHLEYKAKSWDACYTRARHFLAQFPAHELSTFAWRYLIASSSEMASEKPELQKQLLVDLEAFLKQPLPDSEKADWQLLLAKTNYEMRHYEKAMNCLQNLQTPNAHLLLALCYRDGYNDLEHFCELAESALTEGANLIDAAQIHSSLYNACLELSQIEKGAEHLYAAFVAKAEIKTDNLLWLADLYFNRLQEEEGNFVLANRTATILDKCKAAIQNPKDDASSGTPGDPCKAALHGEQVIVCKLAKVYTLLGRVNDAIVLLESLKSAGSEAQLLLAESYAKKGGVDKAIQIFDAIVESSATVRNPVSASASLQGARLKLTGDHPDLIKIATQLKNLVIQKTFDGEPLYLEAALEYVELQSKNDPGKKVALLMKTKHDFETRDDLLSKDYHEARSRYPRKDKMFQGYMQLIEAEILAAQAKLDLQNQKVLQAKSKDLLLQIVNEQTANALLDRANTLTREINR